MTTRQVKQLFTKADRRDLNISIVVVVILSVTITLLQLVFDWWIVGSFWKVVLLLLGGTVFTLIQKGLNKTFRMLSKQL